jgi:hypothetical protein
MGGGGFGGCNNATDCGLAGYAICDPQTHVCGPPECDADIQDCPDGEVCLLQGDEDLALFGGACYTSCTVGQDHRCPSDETCLDINGDEVYGACIRAGTAQKGEHCEGSQTTTDCADGLICLATNNGPGTCFATCDYWGGAAACAADGEWCTYRGWCLDESLVTIDAAGLGQPCSSDASLYCGVSGDKAQGFCVDVGDSGLCLATCRLAHGESGNPDCESGQACTDVGIDYFGVCY